MLATDHDNVLIGPCEQLRPAAGAGDQRLAVEDGTELLGPGVTRDLSGQRLETAPVAARQQQRPGWRRGHGHRLAPPNLWVLPSEASDVSVWSNNNAGLFAWSDRTPGACLEERHRRPRKASSQSWG